MDSDDVWEPEALEILKAEIEMHPECIGAHALGRCIDQYGAEYRDPVYSANGNGRYVCDGYGRMHSLDPSAPTSFRSLWYSNPFPPGLILSRRSAYQTAGFFDGSVCPVEDWDMLIRLSRQGDFRFVQKVVISYRRHENNLSGKSASVNGRQIRGLLHKTFFSGENNAVHGKIVRSNWRATEMLHFRQNWQAAKKHLAKADLPGFLSNLAGGCIHLCRFARGYPTQSRFCSLDSE
jgi:hypothetical protein